MSFELFVWLDERWTSTGRKFKARGSAEAAGKAMVVTGRISLYSPDFDVRESSEKPNELS